MVGHILASFGTYFELRQVTCGKTVQRRSRHRLIPDALSLENRTCLSTMAPAVSGEHLRHEAELRHHAGHHHKAPLVVHHELQHVTHLAKSKQFQTLYVKPGAKPKLNAGKTPNKPLGSVNKALKMIKPGGTIILAPGVYSENIVVSQKSNVTIVGASNHGSILAPASGDALKVALSNNITINEVWLRSPHGRGMTIMGSSVTVNGIKTDGTQDDGVVAASYQGRGATLAAYSGEFNAIQTGDGLHLEAGSSATINSSTFNGVGTAANVSQASNGLVLDGDASVTIVNSQFIGNTNGGLVAQDNTHVTARTSTFASNVKGNGLLLIGNATADLQNNTFATNGVTAGPTTGLNGIELLNGFTGSAYISGNSFLSNTGNGIYIGGGPANVQIVNNVFDNNFVGIAMDSSTGTAIAPIIQGNTIRVPVDASRDDVGILAIGRLVTATVGGDGVLANTFQNYITGTFIYEGPGDGNDTSAGFPNMNILTNIYISKTGQTVSPANAIHRG